MQGVAVGWQVYAITDRPLDLGLVGLAQFLPVLLLFPVSGAVADRYPRHRVVQATTAVSGAGALLLSTLGDATTPGPIYAALVVVALARAFGSPASQALLPALVPPEHFANAVTWSSSLFHLGTIVGPALGGGVYALTGRPEAVYGVAAALQVVAFVAMHGVVPLRVPAPGARPGWGQVLDGVRYVWTRKVILGALSLDLFAVLLGGAVALMPIYARDILHVGPAGLGALRAAPALGAMGTALWLAGHPVGGRAGAKMFAAVAVFGLATIAFGASSTFWASLAALLVVGASDELSVVVRQTVVQIATPEEMRGRVSAVNFVFVGMSNELGELESGLAAQWLGARRAVLLGGVGTLLVVATWWAWARDLRRVDRLDRM